MLAVCYRYTKDTDEAHDVLQEGFVRVFRGLEGWKEKGELGAWIRRIMVNSALNWLRSRRRMKIVSEEQILETHESGSVITPIEQMEARELADLIRELPVGYQTVFNLHAVEGYAHGEIATLLGITEGTARSQYLRARKYLVELIQKTLTEKTENHAGRE
jgi:RNA polymerase sigma-70 factor (ECF subfamily)